MPLGEPFAIAERHDSAELAAYARRRMEAVEADVVEEMVAASREHLARLDAAHDPLRGCLAFPVNIVLALVAAGLGMLVVVVVFPVLLAWLVVRTLLTPLWLLRGERADRPPKPPRHGDLLVAVLAMDAGDPEDGDEIPLAFSFDAKALRQVKPGNRERLLAALACLARETSEHPLDPPARARFLLRGWAILEPADGEQRTGRGRRRRGDAAGGVAL